MKIFLALGSKRVWSISGSEFSNLSIEYTEYFQGHLDL